MVSRLVGRIVSICVFVFLNQSIPRAAAKPEPDFGPNVLVFDPSTPGIQEKLDAVFATQERGEFNSRRYAILLKPGKYNLDVKVGFYTQILGLGRTPDDVSITGAVRSNATWRHGNATINFWRCVENLSVNPPPGAGPDVWAVSQGTALRRVHVRGDLNLSDHGWSSGGFIADSRIDGIVDCGTQQQWLSRNAEFGSWHGGNWNMVFVGVQNPPPGMWPDQPYTTINATPVIREKPYLFVDDADNYCVRVPPMMNDSHGVSWTNGNTPGDSIPIDRFYLAHPNRDNAASINAALESGRNLLLMPGIYHLEDRIRVRQSGTVVLGLGYPTLISENGTPAMIVSDAGGIEIGGILFQAGPIGSPALLEVGPAPSPAKHADDPICLYDIFCRSGGAAAGKTDSMVTINANNVIGDNSWLWRADHGRGVGWKSNATKNGLIVNGRDVTFYGLFVEHCQEYQTLWNGDGGRVFFYQSEMPYDPPSQKIWSHDGVPGFASYKVADSVQTHLAFGLGVYCIFPHALVVSDTAFEAPARPGIQIHDIITLRLGGLAGTGISHIYNHDGTAVIERKSARLN